MKAMYTDPGHLRVNDPGTVEGNVVFTYLDAFDEDQTELDRLKDHYRCGGLGDGTLKSRLEEILQELIAPIRERRQLLAQDLDHVLSVIQEGTERARERTEATKKEVTQGLGLFRL